jgi:hypothetical protein
MKEGSPFWRVEQALAIADSVEEDLRTTALRGADPEGQAGEEFPLEGLSALTRGIVGLCLEAKGRYAARLLAEQEWGKGGEEALAKASLSEALGPGPEGSRAMAYRPPLNLIPEKGAEG